jgi:hypothetical protein
MATIVSGATFNASTDYVYTKPKLNANNGKSIGILNKHNMKSLYVSTPLMLTWGVNEYTDDKTGKKTFDMALQFPNQEYDNPECSAFLKNMQELETRIKSDVITNCKEWLGKPKMSSDAVDALWSPMLKYPRDKATEEPDHSRAPSLKVKLPYWEGVFKDGNDRLEIYSESQELLFPNDDTNSITDFIVKGSSVATIIKCGGIWVANGKFGVTWKLFQTVVKPKTSLSGKCHIVLSEKDKEKLSVPLDDDTCEEIVHNVTQVPDSDDEEEHTNVKKEVEVEPDVEAEVETEAQAKQVQVEDAPKKKRIVKKKSDE